MMSKMKLSASDRLPADFFSVTPLSFETRQQLIELGQKACSELIESVDPLNQQVQWTAISSSSNEVKMFRAFEATTSSDSCAFFKGETQLKGTLDEVCEMFSQQKTTEQFQKSTAELQKDLIDSHLLYNLITPTVDFPRDSISVRWIAIASPTALVNNRDFCYIECQLDFIDSNGRLGWAKSMHSIKLACCPSLEKSHGLVRGSLYRTGYVFRETANPGTLEVVHSMKFDLKGKVPQWVIAMACKRRCYSIGRMDKYLQSRRLSCLVFKGDLELNPKKSCSHCALCHQKFRNFLMHQKARCRLCGEVVCMKCNQKWEVRLPKIGHCKLRICTYCCVNVRKQTELLPISSSIGDNESAKSFQSSQIFNSATNEGLSRKNSSSDGTHVPDRSFGRLRKYSASQPYSSRTSIGSDNSNPIDQETPCRVSQEVIDEVNRALSATNEEDLQCSFYSVMTDDQQLNDNFVSPVVAEAMVNNDDQFIPINQAFIYSQEELLEREVEI